MSDEHLLETSKLKALRVAIDKIEALDFVKRTESLFTVPFIRTIEGYLNKDPYLANIPENAEESKKLLDAALGNPFIKKTIIKNN